MTADYIQFERKFLASLQPDGPLEELHAAEIIRAAWCITQCALADAASSDPKQKQITARERSQAHTILRSSTAELRRLQKDSPANPEPTGSPQPTLSPEPEPLTFTPAAAPRNALCPCGSGTKYKRCCLGKTPAILAAACDPPRHRNSLSVP